MDMDQAMTLALLAIGIGCKSGVSADAVVQLVQAACGKIDGTPTALYTAEEKRGELALAEAAAHLGLPLVFLPQAALKKAGTRALTKSARVLALFGVPSIAETAALAGAGLGAQLVLARITANNVTCAIAAAMPDTRDYS
jgi:cobalt-precorrin 5A hydrolase